MFADYFGDEAPKCTNRCDACADERAVRRALEQHMRRAMSARLERGGFISIENPSDLYGEGRYGQKRCVLFVLPSAPFPMPPPGATHYDINVWSLHYIN